jgi:hypothetical protein
MVLSSRRLSLLLIACAALVALLVALAGVVSAGGLENVAPLCVPLQPVASLTPPVLG